MPDSWIRPTWRPSPNVETSPANSDISALREAAGLPAEESSRSDAALERAVPLRLKRSEPAAVTLRSAFLLAHVDGVSSIAQIAKDSMLSLDECFGHFVNLVVEGFVTIEIRDEAASLYVGQGAR